MILDVKFQEPEEKLQADFGVVTVIDSGGGSLPNGDEVSY